MRKQRIAMDGDSIFELEIDSSSQASFHTVDHGFFDGVHTVEEAGACSCIPHIRHALYVRTGSLCSAAPRIAVFESSSVVQIRTEGILFDEIRTQLRCRHKKTWCAPATVVHNVAAMSAKAWFLH